ncbi:MAG: HAD hydrolase-like protein [Gammaproteobacteria bacterium]
MTVREGDWSNHPDRLAAARYSIGRSAALLVDWDGCLASGEELLPGAGPFLRRYEDRVAIVSNNTTHLPEDFVFALKRQGVRIPAERVVLAGREALHQAIGAAPSGQALVLANARMRTLAKASGLQPHSDSPEVVVLLRDTDFSYERLQQAADALCSGARLIVGNPDLTHPGRNGLAVPETGALLAALSATVDLEKIQCSIIGKPQPALFQRALAAMGVAAANAVMIGDNPSTDGAGAAALGMDFVLVGRQPGVSLAALLQR